MYSGTAHAGAVFCLSFIFIGQTRIIGEPVSFEQVVERSWVPVDESTGGFAASRLYAVERMVA